MIAIMEAEWDGKPTWYIGDLDNDGNVYRALKYIDPGTTSHYYWTNRVEMAWHSPTKRVVEDVFTDMLMHK